LTNLSQARLTEERFAEVSSGGQPNEAVGYAYLSKGRLSFRCGRATPRCCAHYRRKRSGRDLHSRNRCAAWRLLERRRERDAEREAAPGRKRRRHSRQSAWSAK